jgi:SAM-dependent methyltransferase
MFDFVRKSDYWNSINSGQSQEIDPHGAFHLKTIQDLAVWSQLRELKGKVVAEIGGGNSRILKAMAGENTCYNIEKFEGADGGPAKEVIIPNVTNIHTFVGERSGKIPQNHFDVLFSVSVVEHVPDDALDAFLNESVDCLKEGGLLLHAIDLYIEDDPSVYTKFRYDCYAKFLDHPRLEPVGNVVRDAPKFSCSMATNPDNIMHGWAKVAPALDGLRQVAQSVSLIVALRKTGA